MMFWLAAAIGYLCVGFVIARLINERHFRKNGLGKTQYGPRSAEDAQLNAWWRGFGLTLFWPAFVAVVVVLGGFVGFCFGLYKTLRHIYVPGELRALKETSK